MTGRVYLDASRTIPVYIVESRAGCRVRSTFWSTAQKALTDAQGKGICRGLTICATCGRVKAMRDDMDTISHGICGPCAEQELKQLTEDDKDGKGEPTAVIRGGLQFGAAVPRTTEATRP